MKDEKYIKRCLALAKRAEGRTSPNPMVGAVVVGNGSVIGEGYHKKAGMPHAEVIALDAAGSRAAGATLYVSLEPCCHKDKRTPPCTGRIRAAGIRKVVIAMKDPNPKVSGKGVDELEKAGIQVVSGILEDKAMKLNEAYIKYITTGLPFVTLKAAMTLDGKIATPKGESKWITGEAARREVHRLRSKTDAILTAIGTVRADDPQLTCRMNYKGRPAKNPVRIVIDPDLEIREDARILCCPPETIVVTKKSSLPGKKNRMSDIIKLIEYDTDRLDPKWLMKKLGAAGITSVFVEGGSSLNSSLLEAGIVDKVIFYIAPKIIGGRESFPVVGGRTFRDLAHAHRLINAGIREIGEDFVIEGYIRHSTEEL